MAVQELAGGDSLIHRLDPRVKIVLAFLFSVVVAVSSRFVVLTSALTSGLCIVLLVRVPTKEVLRRLVPVNVFILFLWIFSTL